MLAFKNNTTAHYAVDKSFCAKLESFKIEFKIIYIDCSNTVLLYFETRTYFWIPVTVRKLAYLFNPPSKTFSTQQYTRQI